MNNWHRVLGALPVLLLWLAVVVGAAMAQPAPRCLPKPFGALGSELHVTQNEAGVCVKWWCFGSAQATPSVTYCGAWSQVHLVSPRLQTIQKAADPLRSLQELPKRISGGVVPLTDPSMGGMPK